jgi:SAM-dependent methyltransferase
MDWRDWTQKYNLTKPKRLLTTCPTDIELSILEPEATDVYQYNKRNGRQDLHDMSSLLDNTYDLILFAQTLEHLYNPFLAMQQMYAKVAPGGYVFTSTPTLNKPHMTPFHFFHYTPMGLAVLMLQAGFEILETGQFGSFHYEQILLEQQRWPSYADLEAMGNGSIVNTETNPDQVWILVRKPIAAAA